MIKKTGTRFLFQFLDNSFNIISGMKMPDFYSGYNFPMRKRSAIFLSISVLCLGFLLSTIPSTGRSLVEISFTNPSGRSGNVQISYPERVFAGDRAEITANITLMDEDIQNEIEKLAGRLEAGFEEIDPGGETEVILQPGSPVRFSWKVRTTKNSTYPGNLWLWLEADGSRELILVRELNILSKLYFGQPVLFFRVLFSSLLVIIGFMFLIDSHRKKHISNN